MAQNKDKKLRQRTQPILFGCVLIFAFLFFTKPASAGVIIYDTEGSWTTTTGPNNQDYSMNFVTATSGVAFFHWRELTSSVNGCNAHSTGNPTVFIDGVPFEKINTTDQDVNGYNYYLAYASTTIISSASHSLSIDTLEAPSVGYTCTQSFNLFILDDVIASSVLSMVLDLGSEAGGAKDYAFTNITTAKNPNGLKGLMFVGTQQDMTTFVATSSMITINDADATMFSYYKNIPALVQGRYDYGWSSFTPATYLYVYGLLFPFDTTPHIPPAPPSSGALINDWLSAPVGCEDTGVITPFYPASEADGFNYDIFASSTCAGNEVASGTYISYLGGVFDDTVYLPAPSTFGSKIYCMYAHLDQTPQIVDYSYFTMNWLASTSDSCDLSLLMDKYNTYCGIPCYGIATSTNPLDLNNFNCGLRQFGCWLTVVDKNTVNTFGTKWQAMIRRFPLAPITKLIDDLALVATGTQAMTSGNIKLPEWSTSSRQYIAVNYDIGSTSFEHSYGGIKWRRFEVIAMWCLLCALPIALTVIALIL
jgi:hypothetical protein